VDALGWREQYPWIVGGGHVSPRTAWGRPPSADVYPPFGILLPGIALGMLLPGGGAVTRCYASASHHSQPVEPPMSDHRLSLIGPSVPFLRTGLSPTPGVQSPGDTLIADAARVTAM
ncbi:MAG: hypothetical protein ACYC26_05885, partial [Phycisphaerales bacterium]